MRLRTLREEKLNFLIKNHKISDSIIVVSLCVVFFLMATLDLGLSEIPSSSFEFSGNDGFLIGLKEEKNVDGVYFFLKGKINLDVLTGQPEKWDEKRTISVDDYYKWKKIEINRPTSFLKVNVKGSYGELFEIAIIEEGQLIEDISIYRENDEKESPSQLIDEQEKIVLPITYQSETVFDEIYYVRAAESLFSAKEPYETTHPPLGNLIIATGISFFGFNPFGWRIMGVIFATSMIPLLYYLGKEISGSWLGGFFSSTLLILDFMHFTFSRIATIDTFLVFFILGAQLFFYKYSLDVLNKGWSVSLRSYFLSVFLLAIAFSIKWTAVLSFTAQLFYLCLLFFYFTENIDEKKSMYFPDRKTIIYAMSGTIVIFGFVYFLSYVPYLRLGYTLTDVYNRQWYMLNYHLQLKATHPFSSPWWSWPLLSRPIWLYITNLGKEFVSTITLMGNPAVWWMGLVSFTAISEKAIKEKNPSLIYLVILFIFQWIPYIFISRVSFLYYFYPNVIVLCLCTSTQMSKIWQDRKETWKIIANLIIVVILFGLFFPAISGRIMPVWWRNLLRWLPSWVF